MQKVYAMAEEFVQQDKAATELSLNSESTSLPTKFQKWE